MLYKTTALIIRTLAVMFGLYILFYQLPKGVASEAEFWLYVVVGGFCILKPSYAAAIAIGLPFIGIPLLVAMFLPGIVLYYSAGIESMWVLAAACFPWWLVLSWLNERLGIEDKYLVVISIPLNYLGFRHENSFFNKLIKENEED